MVNAFELRYKATKLTMITSPSTLAWSLLVQTCSKGSARKSLETIDLCRVTSLLGPWNQDQQLQVLAFLRLSFLWLCFTMYDLLHRVTFERHPMPSMVLVINMYSTLLFHMYLVWNTKLKHVVTIFGGYKWTSSWYVLVTVLIRECPTCWVFSHA